MTRLEQRGAVAFTGMAATPHFIVGQWQLSRLVAVLNGGCGFYVAGIISGGNSNGQWTGLATFGNGSHGIWIDGSVNAVHSIRISDSFIGADGGHGILDDSHSITPNLYTNVYVESEPGDGFNTANAGNVSLVNCVASCRGSGVKSFAAATSIHGGQFMQNHSFGVWIVQNQASIVGANISGNMAYGIGASGRPARKLSWRSSRAAYDQHPSRQIHRTAARRPTRGRSRAFHALPSMWRLDGLSRPGSNLEHEGPLPHPVEDQPQ